MSALDDLLARARDERGIERLSYFHCDHFEPWRWDMPGVRGVGAFNADAVEAFLDVTATLPHARRLTLFTKSPIRATALPRKRSRTLSGDEISFNLLTKGESAAHDRALHAIAASAHELQVHIHHERFTRNDHYSTSIDRPQNLAFRDFLAHRSTPEMDEARLALYLELTLALFRRSSGLPLRRWLFVHGMWSLNGSDRDFCTVDGEIALLQRLGCVGDFTFPAPRSHCNPDADRPYLVRSAHAPKGYDSPDAERTVAAGQAAGDQFFIWSTAVSARFCSLDTLSRNFAALAEDPARWATGLVDGAVENDGSLYVKTHAHSMTTAYFAGAAPVYPHIHPGVRRLFDTLMEAAARQHIMFDPVTAGEVYDRFVQAPDLEARSLSLPADASIA